MDIEFDKNIPIYMQIIHIIEKGIIQGRIKPGDKLPSIREMSLKLKVNPNTMQRTYQELERRGITYTQRGTGNFVKEDLKMVAKLKEGIAQRAIDGFINGMKDIGFSNLEIIEIVQKRINQEEI